eukprot:Gregarina_sp_Poly_1__4914@NODE_2606_length_1926_cov_26_935449_g1651_i0_p1_GENE_NODE_2606_length_1926_cov_26_935449_g1651_i0NODE_2606_length_1926_cov_26_935449_g1651_i0_p1_ORF_typecomplete_len610_score76_76AAA_lid_7/PF17867_1/0_42_NODE_2606_length_1926_cov_26_935449_g1651_i0101839
MHRQVNAGFFPSNQKLSSFCSLETVLNPLLQILDGRVNWHESAEPHKFAILFGTLMNQGWCARMWNCIEANPVQNYSVPEKITKEIFRSYLRSNFKRWCSFPLVEHGDHTYKRVETLDSIDKLCQFTEGLSDESSLTLAFLIEMVGTRRNLRPVFRLCSILQRHESFAKWLKGMVQEDVFCVRMAFRYYILEVLRTSSADFLSTLRRICGWESENPVKEIWEAYLEQSTPSTSTLNPTVFGGHYPDNPDKPDNAEQTQLTSTLNSHYPDVSSNAEQIQLTSALNPTAFGSHYPDVSSNAEQTQLTSTLNPTVFGNPVEDIWNAYLRTSSSESDPSPMDSSNRNCHVAENSEQSLTLTRAKFLFALMAQMHPDERERISPETWGKILSLIPNIGDIMSGADDLKSSWQKLCNVLGISEYCQANERMNQQETNFPYQQSEDYIAFLRDSAFAMLDEASDGCESSEWLFVLSVCSVHAKLPSNCRLLDSIEELESRNLTHKTIFGRVLFRYFVLLYARSNKIEWLDGMRRELWEAKGIQPRKERDQFKLSSQPFIQTFWDTEMLLVNEFDPKDRSFWDNLWGFMFQKIQSPNNWGNYLTVNDGFSENVGTFC